jgi:hypothetical protein
LGSVLFGLKWEGEVVKRVSLIAAVGAAVSPLLLLPATGSVAATSSRTAAAATAASVTYHGSPGSAARLTQAGSVSSLPVVTSIFHNQGPHVFAPLAAQRPAGSSGSGTAAAPSASANATVGASTAAGAGLIHRFNGMDNLISDSLNGTPITPPDQGLCVGYDATLNGHPKAVWEPVNIAAQETTPSGKPLRPDVTLSTIFQDPYAEGDVRCLYDPGTQSFYFTEIGFPVATGPASDENNTTVDVTVINAHGVAAYQFDTSLGGPAKGDCFGDQPKSGFDNNALVISTDEYCGPTESNYEGAIVLTISKPQLVSEATTVDDSVLGPVSLSGIPVTGLDPAINTGSGTGYLVNSFAFLANGDNNPVGNSVGSWTLTNTAAVTSGFGSPTLTGTATPSEPYAFPVPATSTGNGSTSQEGASTITSETALNPDDSRMSGPVEVTRTYHGVELWTALDAAVTVHGVTTDAAAWFAIDPVRRIVASQGYVVAKGANLIYPALQPRQRGPAAMVFTITSKTINPSAAYTTLGSGRITTVAEGSGPHLSFSDAPPYSTARWGDYSFVAPDPDGSGVWLATEYIPPKTDWDPYDNWGTYVFELSGH